MWAPQFKNTRLLCFLFCAVIGGCVFPAWSAEPRYRGKSLTKWLQLYQKADKGTSEERQAGMAVRTIGTNALPYLTEWIVSEDLEKQFKAKDGFQILGSAAAPAIPSLGKMLTSTNEVVSFEATQSLGHIGAPALPE